MPKINFPTGEVIKEFNLKTEMIIPSTIKLKIRPSLKREVTLGLMKRIKFTKEQLEEIEADDNKGNAKEKIIEEKIAESIISETLVDKFDFAIDHAMNLITDWDLENNTGVPIACNSENKEKYLKPLMWEHVEEEESEEGEEEGGKKSVPFLYFKVIKFASNIRNFTKN